MAVEGKVKRQKAKGKKAMFSISALFPHLLLCLPHPTSSLMLNLKLVHPQSAFNQIL